MMPKVIGLTGQTGSGKSTVDHIFAERDFEVIDADLVSRQVVQRGSECLCRLSEHFGGYILTAAGELNRPALASIVFRNKDQLAQLNKIIYPYILKEIYLRIDKAALQGKQYILLDAPTLYESEANDLCDFVIAIVADPVIRLKRIVERDHLTEAAAKERIAAQHSDDFYRQRADIVIENNGDLLQLETEINAVIDELKS